MTPPTSDEASRLQSISLSRSTPVRTPIPSSMYTTSSVATLPVAPTGTGQQPSSPKLDSNELTPAT